MKDLILKYTLINAIDYDGQASLQSVIGKMIAERPELKSKIKEMIPEIKKTINEVNSWGLKKQKERLKKLGIIIEKKDEKKVLPELPDAKMGKVITAFPPEPSKYPHIGHAKAALINYLYAKKYRGKFILRFEDTNPELAKEEYYKAIIDGLKWLKIKWNKIDYLSDHIKKFYKIAEVLIKRDKAYVCLCKQEQIKKNRFEKRECACRRFDKKKNMKLWKDMQKKMKPGRATLRLKIDMSHINTTMRDPSIFRIIDARHTRTENKYRVWPMYDFANSLMDSFEHITHRIRSKEFEIRKELHVYIQKLLGYKPPHITEIGRFNLKGVPSSGRQIREMIKNKELIGWDDPRLTTLVALKRRGFHPEAIKNFLISTGISKAEGVLTWDVLEAENRKVIDSIANRYFGVLDPVKISIKNAPKLKYIKTNNHPDFPKRGKRKIVVDVRKIYIERDDYENFKGKEIRLIGLFNIRLNEISEFTGNEIMDVQKIHWVSEPNIKVNIIMPNGSAIKALAEPSVKDLKINQNIQLIRIGFCRVDCVKNIKMETVLYFTHK